MCRYTCRSIPAITPMRLYRQMYLPAFAYAYTAEMHNSCSLSDLPSLDEEVYPFVALVCVLYLTFFGVLSGHNFL